MLRLAGDLYSWGKTKLGGEVRVDKVKFGDDVGT